MNILDEILEMVSNMRLCHCGTYEQALNIARKESETNDLRGDCDTWLLVVGLAQAAVAVVKLVDVLHDHGFTPSEAAKSMKDLTDDVLSELLNKQVKFILDKEKNRWSSREVEIMRSLNMNLLRRFEQQFMFGSL